MKQSIESTSLGRTVSFLKVRAIAIHHLHSKFVCINNAQEREQGSALPGSGCISPLLLRAQTHRGSGSHALE